MICLVESNHRPLERIQAKTLAKKIPIRLFYGSHVRRFAKLYAFADIPGDFVCHQIDSQAHENTKTMLD